MNISFPFSCHSRNAYSILQQPMSNSFDLNTLTTTYTHSNIRKTKANHHPVIPFSSSYQRRVFAIMPAGGDDAFSSPTKSLRKLLGSPGIHLGPACYDALSAKLVEKAGFDFCFTTGTDEGNNAFQQFIGFGISAARLGLPDTGLISYGEMVDQGQQITGAVSIPIIGDGDNGYGNPMNVKRTVKGYIRAGFAGIIIEDQVSPKACGHTQGRKVVSREEAVIRIKAAVDARKESGSDIVIVARTDSRQAVSLKESLWRARALADAGADVLFIDALASKEEMKAFCEVSPLLPKMANMLEGGGRTPILSPIELADVGYKLVAYPLSLLGVSIRAMQSSNYLRFIEKGKNHLVGPNPYIKCSLRCAERASLNLLSTEQADAQLSEAASVGNSPTRKSSYSLQRSAPNDPEMGNQSTEDPVVEVVTPEIYSNYVADGSSGPFSGIWSRKLRVRITGRDGFERLDVRIPAGFLEGITNIVPALGGINIKALLDDAALEEGGKQLLDFNDTMGDRIQVFLE
ncbi:hypothetical protein DH2020_020160 [Rehmannia glutinosa]|uniref:Isocitrate lyase n=1 Tax=Rehmannia glutinosa TaxID=99300 RepID=A0ABR0WHG0_REHGL